MSERIKELLAAPRSPESAAEVMGWVDSKEGLLASGGLYIGTVSLDDLALIPRAIEYAARSARPELYLRLASWFANPPLGEPQFSKSEEALAIARSHGVPGADIALVELRWFWRRDEATTTERVETYALLESMTQKDPQDSRAIHLLGLLACQGFGVAPSPERALKLQLKSASLGEPSAMFELYVHYTQGLGTERDTQMAFRYNQQAADLDHPRATYNMGAFYATGQFVSQDMALAAKWYEKSSDLGNPQATATLAMMYAQGAGVEQDLEYAEELFGMADYMGFDVSELRKAAGLPPL